MPEEILNGPLGLRLVELALASLYPPILSELSDAQLIEAAKDSASTLTPFDSRQPEKHPITTEPLHADARVAYRKAGDARVYYRIYKTAARRHRELVALATKQVGRGATYKYASPSALATYNAQKLKTAAFLKSAIVYDASTGTSVPLKDVMSTPEMQASKRLAFLKAIEQLAQEARLQWAMMTITLPAEYHPNPSNGKASFNGTGFDQQQKLLAAKFDKVSSMMRKTGVRLSGVRVHEPHADGTPHWHVLFFYKTEDQLKEIARCFFFHFPARLRIRRVLTDKSGFVKLDKKGGLRFDVNVFDTVEDFVAGKVYKTAGAQKYDPTKVACQCQLDVGASKLQVFDTDTPATVAAKEAHNGKVSSMASYVMKYVNKTTVHTSQELPPAESLPLSLITANRQTWGIRAVQFFGVPAISQKWDMLRKVNLKDPDLDPVARAYAELAQQEKGQGAYEFMRRAGGLAVAPTGVQVKLSTIFVDRETRHGAPTRKATGLTFDVPYGPEVALDGLKSLTKSIQTKRAAAALEAAFAADNRRETAVAGEFARQLVSLYITPTNSTGKTSDEARNPFVQSTASEATKAQIKAATSAIEASHALIAAAGSGKSHTLVERVKYLISQNISIRDILVFSFTKDSSRSLSTRLNEAGVRGVKCSTMHSFARTLLAPYSSLEKYQRADADKYLEDVLALSVFKVDPPADGSQPPELTEAQKAKLAFKTKHAKRYYVLVDEAQDLNSLNYAFLTFLAKTLYAVGDFRQAIYQFRGAKPELFQAFKDDLEAQVGTTSDMFKTTPPMVHSILTTFRNSTAVNALSNAVAHQLDPTASFTASLDTASPGHVFTQITTDEETEYQAILAYMRQASRSLIRSNAVLARTQAQLNFIKSRFAIEGIQDVEFFTIHASKGLEFHNVVIACGSRSDREDSADFPNLSYVAITRAENDLLLTSQGAFPEIIENALEHCKAFGGLR